MSWAYQLQNVVEQKKIYYYYYNSKISCKMTASRLDFVLALSGLEVSLSAGKNDMHESGNFSSHKCSHQQQTQTYMHATTELTNVHGCGREKRGRFDRDDECSSPSPGARSHQHPCLHMPGTNKHADCYRKDVPECRREHV